MNYLIKYAKYSANVLLWILTLLFIIFAMPKLIIIALPFILGWLMALIANPFVRWMDKKFNVPRKLSSAIIVLLIFALIVFVIYLLVSKLISETTNFIAQVPDIYQSFSEDFNIIEQNVARTLNSVPEDFRIELLGMMDRFSDFVLNSIQKLGQTTITSAGTFAKNIPSILVAMIITVLSAYFMIADKESISKFIASHFSKETRSRTNKLTDGMRSIFSGYLKAQFIILAFVGVILFIGFLILKVKFAFLLAILVALLDFLPFFGTGTALGPWGLFHLLSGDYRMAIGLAIIYVVSQLARRVIEPKVLGQTIGMNPLLTMILMYVGYKVVGVLGLIFAAPVGMLIINLDKQGMFDNFKFIVKDIYHDFADLRSIDRYKKNHKKS